MVSTNNLKLYSDKFLQFNTILRQPSRLSQIDLLKTTTDSQKNYLNLIAELGNTGLYIDGLVPKTRILTINTISQDLSEDRTWTIDTGGDSNLDGGYSFTIYTFHNIDGGGA